MEKKLIVLLLLLFVSPLSQAKGFFNNTILGLAYINQTAEIEVSGTGPTITRQSESGTGFSIYLDKYYNRSFRLSTALSYVSYINFDLGQLTIATDYLIPVSEEISFFGGLSLGAVTQKYANANLTETSLGSVYGAQAGVIIYLNKYLMLEGGYRYRPASIETEITGTTGAISTVTDLSESYFSLLFMF
ncbi:hypothetical protein MNBD_GAMMA09-379 [hydrothermal vent metagenome]|uniref:Outer membrane protein beta-barrel domain-containing protein n=1 Tax=hydrothermal vent metagenome TaxID=652676 RepID=A0A3B0Y045_9ZZZZ